MVPCVVYEDEHLLAVDKPAGWNTHSPGPYAGDGIYDWLRGRKPHWSNLAIIHRLDKETSGLVLFGKTSLANKSLTQQFTHRQVHKRYILLSAQPMPKSPLVVKSTLRRIGESYASVAGGEPAETKFTLISGDRSLLSRAGLKMICAEPLTGRTHQIRVHAAESGFPILGDTIYGGAPFRRVCLHAAEMKFTHPATQKALVLKTVVDFEKEPRFALRNAIIDTAKTNSYRLIHGASDGWPGWFVDKLGDFLLSQSESSLGTHQSEELARLAKMLSAQGVYHKTLSRQVRRSNPAEASPRLILGGAAPARFEIRENGLRYELSFDEGYSVGLFLDQRDNRRRLMTGHVAAGFPPLPGHRAEVLNGFAYTCGFSVSAAQAGAHTTSLDLSKKYLGWGRRNFELNNIDPTAHDFIYGDVFDWLGRLARKRRLFDIILLDPPTFSQSKENGVFRVQKNFGGLVSAALPLLKPGAFLLASTNDADWPPEAFFAAVEGSVKAARRKILRQHYAPQPPDFPVTRSEPGYLKTVWAEIA